MDLRAYYKKLHEMEAKIDGEFPLLVSRETGNGGKEGARTEVPRRLAAKMLIEGSARLATAEEAKRYREETEEARKAAEQMAAAAKMQFSLLSTADLERIRGKAPAKG